jgi:hypothetical protein
MLPEVEKRFFKGSGRGVVRTVRPAARAALLAAFEKTASCQPPRVRGPAASQSAG